MPSDILRSEIGTTDVIVTMLSMVTMASVVKF